VVYSLPGNLLNLSSTTLQLDTGQFGCSDGFPYYLFAKNGVAAPLDFLNISAVAAEPHEKGTAVVGYPFIVAKCGESLYLRQPMDRLNRQELVSSAIILELNIKPAASARHQ
jgi:hypothetical protein